MPSSSAHKEHETLSSNKFGQPNNPTLQIQMHVYKAVYVFQNKIAEHIRIKLLSV